jgi:hypothetical protein
MCATNIDKFSFSSLSRIRLQVFYSKRLILFEDQAMLLVEQPQAVRKCASRRLAQRKLSKLSLPGFAKTFLLQIEFLEHATARIRSRFFKFILLNY